LTRRSFTSVLFTLAVIEISYEAKHLRETVRRSFHSLETTASGDLFNNILHLPRQSRLTVFAITDIEDLREGSALHRMALKFLSYEYSLIIDSASIAI